MVPFKPYNSTPGTNGDESNLTEISRICQQQLVAILIVTHEKHCLNHFDLLSPLNSLNSIKERSYFS